MGCRARRPQAELVRIARSPDGTLHLGRTLPGRGAWLCRGSLECFDSAVRRQAFARAWRAGVDSGAIEQLRTNFASLRPAARD